jgi:hypothetical protein
MVRGEVFGGTNRAFEATKTAEQNDYTMAIAQARQMCETITVRRVIRLGVGLGGVVRCANVYETLVATAKGEMEETLLRTGET